MSCNTISSDFRPGLNFGLYNNPYYNYYDRNGNPVSRPLSDQELEDAVRLYLTAMGKIDK